MLTVSRSVFHSKPMEAVVGDLFRTLLPTAQDFVLRNAHPHKTAQVFSILMLLVSSTGVFLPLEVALNDVWGVKTNRNYLHNQVVSLGLAFAVGALAMASVAFSAAQKSILTWVFFQHTDNVVFTFATDGFLNACALVASILLFFLIYWLLPNRKVPPLAVLPTAVVIGILWEIAKYLYVLALPKLDFREVYGPFYISAGLMMWAFLSGLLLLAGAHFSATRHALKVAREESQAADESSIEQGQANDDV
jgi:membrane protein